MKLSDYILIRDIAEEYGLSYHVVYARLKRRKINMTKLGNLWFVSRKDVDKVNHPANPIFNTRNKRIK